MSEAEDKGLPAPEDWVARMGLVSVEVVDEVVGELCRLQGLSLLIALRPDHQLTGCLRRIAGGNIQDAH